MFDQLADQLSSSAASYPLISGIVFGDAILPILPGETAIITGGILSSRDGGLSVVLVWLAGALGAFGGDNVIYWLGRRATGWTQRTLLRSDKSKQRFEWAKRQLDTRGSTIVVSARFIPGGRTATCFSAGAVGFSWKRFALADALGAALWSGLAAVLGYAGGHTFEDSVWKPLLLSLALGILAGLAVELVSRGRRART